MHRPLPGQPSLIPPGPKEKFPWNSKFLTESYLPDTYFPNMKRPVWLRLYNPDIDGLLGMQNKRRRVCPSPVEHRNLIELRRLERENEKLLKGGSTCSSHGGVMRLPVQVLKYLQQQEGTMNRLQRGQSEVLEQVSEFSRILRDAIEQTKIAKESKNETGKPIKVVWTLAQHRMFQTYYAFIVQMLNNFKGMRFEDARGRSLSSSVLLAVSLPNPVVVSTFECIKQIRSLIQFHCNFDCDEGMDSFLDSGVPVTYDSVFQSLVRMERNMKEFLKRVIVRDLHSSRDYTDGTPSRLDLTLQQSLPAIDSTPHPMHASTPLKKHSADSSVVELEEEWRCGIKRPTLTNVFKAPSLESSRAKKVPKRVSFANYPDVNSMDVDD